MTWINGSSPAIMIGGLDPTLLDWNQTLDHMPSQIAIFDLNYIACGAKFDKDAESYIPHGMIQRHYESNYSSPQISHEFF